MKHLCEVALAFIAGILFAACEAGEACRVAAHRVAVRAPICGITPPAIVQRVVIEIAQTIKR